MRKYTGKRGSAVTEYVLIAVVFALGLGFTIFQMSPDLLRTYFVKSIDKDGAVSGGGMTMKVMGE